MPATALPEIEIRDCGPADLPRLRAMYETFEPRAAARGLPPAREEKTRRWLDHLDARSVSLIAVVPGGAEPAVGHAILAEGTAEAELALFVHQDFRGAGLGTALTRAAIALSRRRGHRRIWLTVAADNAAAQKVYERCGFRTVRSTGFPDQEMELVLKADS